MKKLKNQAGSLSDYKELFETDVGKKVLHDLMKCHHVLTSTFSPGDPYDSAYREGERAVVLRIMRRTKTDVKKYLKQLEDMQKQQESLED